MRYRETGYPKDKNAVIKEGSNMKHNYSRLCLKERWLTFALCVILAVVAGIFAFYSFMEDKDTGMMIAIVFCVVMVLCAVFVLRLNLRRKRIQKEFVFELDKELRSKENICPRCGSKIGASNTCSKCGYKGH